MRVRTFNGAGHQEYKKFIGRYLLDISIDKPDDQDLLLNDNLTNELSFPCEVELQEFETRYDFGSYLLNVFDGCPRKLISENSELWDWLALFFFDQIRGTKDYTKFVLEKENYQKWYRHLVRLNWQLVDSHGEACRWMMLEKPKSHGDLIEQPVSRESIAKNTELLKAARHLYFANDKVKKGARGGGQIDGDINRFVIWVQQVEKTYDLDSMYKEKILELIPRGEEFDNWLT